MAISLPVALAVWWLAHPRDARTDAAPPETRAARQSIALKPTAADDDPVVFRPPTSGMAVHSAPAAGRPEPFSGNAYRAAWPVRDSEPTPPTPVETRTSARPPSAMNGLAARPTPIAVPTSPPSVGGLPPGIPGGPAPAIAPPAGSSRHAPEFAQAVQPAPRIERDGHVPLRAHRLGGSGAPTVWAVNGSGSTTINVASVVGADRFYSAGYTGLNAHVANIEGGTPLRTHETLSGMPLGNIFTFSTQLNETSSPTSIADHATATSMNMVGRPPAGSLDPTLQRGIAYGVNLNNFYAGNIASTFGSGGSFTWSSYADFRNSYYRAIVEGVGSGNTINAANRVDVVNSSWGGDAINGTEGSYNLFRASRIVDAIALEGNQSRGSSIVFSAGNSGPGANSIVVGALGETATDAAGTATYNVATTFSSRGPINYYLPGSATDIFGTLQAGVIRPRVDIAAPGFQMKLANASGPTGYGTWAGTSFAAPTVAGGIALLADYSWTNLGANAGAAVDGRVIRAVLINSADKTSGWDNGQTWNGAQWATTQGLDYTTGGGRLNLDQAFNQYANAAGNTITQLINPSGGGPHSVLSTGWARATIDRPSSTVAATVDFLINGPLTKNTELNTTLNWFVNGVVSFSTATALGFHNLNLEVWLTDGAGNATTRVGVSTADHNNVEHLSFLVPQDGQYLIRVARPTDANGGTYYTFPGDSTSDVFGLAWMARPGLQALTGTTTVNTGIQNPANVLIAPDAGQTATLAVSGAGTRINALNRLFVGGTDRGAGGAGTLTVTGGAVVDVSDRLQVYGHGTVSVTDSTLSGGVLGISTLDGFTLSGTSIVQFSRIDMLSPITVTSGGNVTIRSYTDFNGNNSGRVNILDAAASFDVNGQLTLQPIITGSNGLVKNGSGTLFLAPASGGQNSYTGTTLVNAGTLQLGAESALPTGNNVTVAAGATFSLGIFGNTTATAIGTVTLNGGTLRVPSDQATYNLNKLAMTGGTVDLTGTFNFWLAFVNSGAGITTNASSTTALWIGSDPSRIQNDTTSALTITVAAGTTPNGIDLDAGILISADGNNPGFIKAGPGTMRLTNTGNTANFTVAQGTLRFDDVLALPSGTLTLSGGTLAYGSTTADGTTNQPITFAAPANAGIIQVMNAARTLTLSGSIDYGNRFLVKNGLGTLVLSGANIGTVGTETQIQAGLLRAANNAAIPTGSTVRAFNTGTFQIDSGITVNADINAQPGGTFAGAGAVATGRSVTLANGTTGGTIAPGANGGAALGTLTLIGTTGLTAAAGSHYQWQVNAVPASGAAGTNWDFLSAGGILANASSGGATNGNPFIIDVVKSGSVPGFSTSSTYTWTAATFAGGITFPLTAFAANPVGWGDLGGNGFSIVVSGNDLNIVFAPVPEPATVLGIAVAILLIAHGLQRLRRKCPEAT